MKKGHGNILIGQACLRYIEAQQAFLRSDDMPAVWAFRRASDDLLGAFHEGIPVGHIPQAWLSFRQALVRAAKDEQRSERKCRWTSV